MHCHLDFLSDPAGHARELAASGVSTLSVTVDAHDYVRLHKELGDRPGTTLALGLHPWRVADGSCDEGEVALFERLASEAVAFGEVGLDLSGARGATRDMQVEVLSRVLRAAAGAPRRQGGDVVRPARPVVSLHAVRSATEVLDVLDLTGALDALSCVFHWFSGTSDELARARDAGCWFSVGPGMLSSRRGREYARQVPLDRLLLETDAPSAPGEPLSSDEHVRMLSDAVRALEGLRGEPVAAAVTNNACELLGL
jgi:TatD DNase family protein